MKVLNLAPNTRQQKSRLISRPSLMLGDHSWDGGWPSWGSWLTIYGNCPLELDVQLLHKAPSAALHWQDKASLVYKVAPSPPYWRHQYSLFRHCDRLQVTCPTCCQKPNLTSTQQLGFTRKNVPWLSQQCSRPLPSIKVANGSIVQHMGTILGWVGSGQLTCDYNAISVQLQLQLPTGTELGKIGQQLQNCHFQIHTNAKALKTK